MSEELLRDILEELKLILEELNSQTLLLKGISDYGDEKPAQAGVVVKESIQQDLNGVTVLGKKGNAYVVFKGGYSAYLGQSTIKTPITSDDFGTVKNIELLPKYNWIIEKNKIDWKKGVLQIDLEAK